jgi:hypothetical protein
VILRWLLTIDDERSLPEGHAKKHAPVI